MNKSTSAKARDDLREVYKAVAFFSSVIKSGEPWTEWTEAAHSDAKAAFDRLDDALKDYCTLDYCPGCKPSRAAKEG